MLGIGPLILAPLSETFGRRNLYLTCFTVFAILQIPTALAPNIALLIAVRSVSGFFGSIGIANGGGTISDMFIPSERAGVFGWYLLGPLLGPTLGPLFGGFIVQRLGWRWIFWIMTIVCFVNTLAGYFFLRETYAPVILARLKRRFEDNNRDDDATKYCFEGEDSRPLRQKVAHSLSRPPRIFAQPIVAIMNIYSGSYGFSTEKVGLLYLGPGLGFLFAVWFLVPRIDSIYKALTAKHNEKPMPEFRLPLANIGAVFIPVSLFWFAWSVEKKVMILNTTQNYYIDAFETYAASAIAAGAVFRSLVGGLVPLIAPMLFDKLGYGWGISVFGFVGLVLAPAPVLFYAFGERIREKFTVKL
ncbi:hypothetical protein N0V90_012736 [Kalmusia sp. IMI 367209]|nr:hypothetical protein N0V90_012736 [Kalmusia sp. IMI 367209]